MKYSMMTFFQLLQNTIYFFNNIIASQYSREDIEQMVNTYKVNNEISSFRTKESLNLLCTDDPAYLSNELANEGSSEEYPCLLKTTQYGDPMYLNGILIFNLSIYDASNILYTYNNSFSEIVKCKKTSLDYSDFISYEPNGRETILYNPKNFIIWAKVNLEIGDAVFFVNQTCLNVPNILSAPLFIYQGDNNFQFDDYIIWKN
ncbi:hypothetical protein NUSPORA_02599 [Nucleospora cyclopteri]